MHNLKTNFDKFFDITKLFFEGLVNEDYNLQFYPRKPKMSDCEIITLSVLCEALGIDSENYLFGKLRIDHHDDFPNLIDRSNFNRRRKRLGAFILRINKSIADYLNEGEDTYIIDSVPVPVCQLSREKSSKICKENYETAPARGYSSVNKAWYYGYKLHLITSVKGVYTSMDITKASIHDIKWLNDVKYSGLGRCVIIGDKGYLSNDYQLDLFNSCQIKLETPKRKNQDKLSPFPVSYAKARKRIETLFAQLCDQQMLKRNYAKTKNGVAIRLVCKITSVTFLQYVNFCNNKPLNHLKYALAS